MTAVPGLGPLESAVMGVLWEHGAPLKVAGIIPLLDYPLVPHYNTVTTILASLRAKGLVTRELHDGKRCSPVWHWQAVDRDGWLATRVAGLLALAGDPAAVVAAALNGPAGRG